MRKRFFVAMAGMLSIGLIAVAPLKAATNKPAKQVNTYILLDRTGSMEPLWAEALSSVNAFAENVGKADPKDPTDRLEARVTLAVFDAQGSIDFNVLRDKVRPQDWRKVTSEEANPRGTTPLYDAIGQMMSVVNTDNPERAVIVIMSDGEENASREIDRDRAKALLDGARKRGYEVVFLGADFANFSDAGGVGITPTRSMAIEKENLNGSMQSLAKKSRNYGNTNAEVTFDEKDRQEAGEEKVKAKNNQ